MLLVCCVRLQLAAEEEKRPYQFGFNIGTQHREEKKGELEHRVNVT